MQSIVQEDQADIVFLKITSHSVNKSAKHQVSDLIQLLSIQQDFFPQ